MKAILLRKENFPTISEECPQAQGLLYGLINPMYTHGFTGYFISQYDKALHPETQSWAVVTGYDLFRKFDFDQFAIDDTFVELVRI